MAEEPEKTYSAEKARQGQVVLRHWWSRAIFILGLVLFVLAGIFLPMIFG